ncbi:MAG: cytochrome c3 family protein [Desulfovibrio sp.]|jgi:nitrate reductase gamma subunit|nr:cytochrome c3 family protein [Desulfovibrio sp.]
MHPWFRSNGVATFIAAALTALVCCCLPGRALAGPSWFVDEARLHASAHTQAGIACADCHADVAESGGHPSAGDVGKDATTAFKPETCLNCHDAVSDDIAAGKHGGKPLETGKDYAACVSCHDPHGQLGAKAREAGLTARSDISASCAVCHEAKSELPAPEGDVATCLSCHGLRTGGGIVAAKGAPKPPADKPQGPAMCLRCHGPEGEVQHMDADGLASQTHKSLNCLACHAKGAQFPHMGQPKVDCRSCHKARHDEATIHDPHTRVECGSCHLGGVSPVLENGRVGFVVTADPLKVHDMKPAPGKESCLRCHVPGNAVGATDAVLPAKSILCIGCHAATFTTGDTVSRLGLGVFLVGFLFIACFWFSGTNLGETAPGGGSAPLEHGCPHEPHGSGENRWHALVLDVFGQRRLYQESPSRWAIHALIFFPFLFRCVWGIIGQLGSLLAPESDWPFVMLDKDWSVTALLFDLSGLALLAGLILAALRWRGERRACAGTPKRDWPALWLLLALVATGFVLEGVRMALTGFPSGSGFAFAGYALATCLADVPMASLAHAHSFLWNVHAIVTAIIVAYMPFSQLRHVVTTPVNLLFQTLRRR